MFSSVDLILIECMYDEDRIGSHHGNIERILKYCTPKEYSDRFPLGRLKRRMRQLSTQGYLLRKKGRYEAYSLAPKGVIIAARIKDGWTLDQINEEEKREGLSEIR